MGDRQPDPRVCLTLPPTPGIALREARDQVRRLVVHNTPAGRVVDAVLLVNELVTNAYRHGRPPRTLRLDRDSDGPCLWVEVDDHAPVDVSRVCEASPANPRGQGLLLIDRLCTRWGVLCTWSRKTVWAGVTLLDANHG